MNRLLFVLHVFPDPNTAVYGKYLQFAEFLQRHGVRAEILTPSNFRIPNWLLRLLPIIYPFFVAYWFLRRKEEYSVVVFHSYAGWVVNRFRSILLSADCLTVTAYHGLEPLYVEASRKEAERSGSSLSLRFRMLQRIMQALMRDSTQRSNLVQCLNSAERNYLITNKWADPKNISQLPNFVLDDFFREHEYPEHATRLLFVGSWLNIKGIRYLVQAFKRISAVNPMMVLMCAGTGSPGDQVLKSFPSSLIQQISVIPRIPHKELPDLYQNADIFVFPSLSEGFSVSLLEAMAAGLPVVTTAVGASSDMISDGQNGIVVPVADSNSLAEAVLRLASDQKLREQVGNAARQTARSFMAEDVCRLLAESLYVGSSL